MSRCEIGTKMRNTDQTRKSSGQEKGERDKKKTLQIGLQGRGPAENMVPKGTPRYERSGSYLVPQVIEVYRAWRSQNFGFTKLFTHFNHNQAQVLREMREEVLLLESDATYPPFLGLRL